ncbi:MAG: carbonic anhydrase/acetyltransferase-like protein (isoleucine patch superfamily) [Natronomonas sp.]|jgi:carbonic anhydrase/acetyltransferase-like protein (isoleucine patch superfamily)
MGATVLDRSILGERAMVGANSLATEDTEIGADTLYAGVPADFLKRSTIRRRPAPATGTSSRRGDISRGPNGSRRRNDGAAPIAPSS